MVEGAGDEARGPGRAPVGSPRATVGRAGGGRAGTRGERASAGTQAQAEDVVVTRDRPAHSVFGAAPARPAGGGDAGARSSGGQSAALIRPRPLVRVQARPPAEPHAAS